LGDNLKHNSETARSLEVFKRESLMTGFYFPKIRIFELSRICNLEASNQGICNAHEQKNNQKLPALELAAWEATGKQKTRTFTSSGLLTM
jgi:hypothetical protein